MTPGCAAVVFSEETVVICEQELATDHLCLEHAADRHVNGLHFLGWEKEAPDGKG